MHQDNDLEYMWSMVLQNLRKEYKGTDYIFDLWFGNIEFVSLDEKKAVLGCPSDTIKKVISERYMDILTDSMNEVIRSITGNPDSSVTVELESSKKRDPQTVREPSQPDDAGGQLTIQTDPGKTDVPLDILEEEPPISDENDVFSFTNTEYTFDNFVQGASNEVAYAASRNIAEGGMSINPLFIWGKSGLGKTHLMCAIAHRAHEKNPKLKVIYIKAEDLKNQVVNNLMQGGVPGMNALHDKFRNVDMLLVDDIQYLENKEASQKEFFHTFETLYFNNKQIIITSDRLPKDLPLSERLVTRFEQGLITDIKPPEYETRQAILYMKARQYKIQLSAEIVDFLAEKIQDNVRQLEGIVKKLAITHILTGQPVNMEMVIRIVPEYMRDTEPVSDVVDRIINSAANLFRVSPSDIKGPQRNKDIKNARNACMVVIRDSLSLSLSKIGEIFGRDSATVFSNIKSFKDDMENDPSLKTLIEQLQKEVLK